MTRSRYLLFTCTLTIALAACTFLVFSRDAAYRSAIIKLQTSYRVFDNANIITYGTATEATQNTLSFLVKNPYEMGGPPRTVTVKVSPETLIVRQTLVGNDNVYSSLSEPIQASIEDINQGDHIAVLLRREADQLYADGIFFGDPL